MAAAKRRRRSAYRDEPAAGAAETPPAGIGHNSIGPQAGPQTAFLSTPADIAIYGGAAGGGKTFALLLEPLRHVHNPHFGAVYFRRTTPQITNEGALWDTSETLYPLLQAAPVKHVTLWRFPSGASVKFSHLEHDKTRLEYQGAQIPLICFDELTHFTAKQFWYLFSRNRSDCGVRPYIRATCNPDPDSWVAELIGWWIDQETGLAIPERAGVIRWFVRLQDQLHWGDTREELLERFKDLPPDDVQPKSLTFIPAKLSDNAIFMAKDPGYRANLLAMPMVEREQLLNGNWKIRPAAGMFFRRTWCEVVDAFPAGTLFRRGWDLAGTPKTETNDPDWTAGCKIGHMPDGRFIVADHRRTRDTPGEVEKFVKNTASDDGRACEVDLPQDPAQAGKWQVQSYIRALAGYIVRSSPEGGSKATRFRPFSAQAQAGNVVVLRGEWNKQWFDALEGFTGEDGMKDDDADATSRAFNGFLELMSGEALFELERRAAEARAAQQAALEGKLAKPDHQPGSVEHAREQAEKAEAAMAALKAANT